MNNNTFPTQQASVQSNYSNKYAPSILVDRTPYSGLQQCEQFIKDNYTDDIREAADQVIDADYSYFTRDHLDHLNFQINYFSIGYIVQGRLLAEIAYKRLYKHKYSSFHAYCCNLLEMTESRARQIMEASRVAIELIKAGFVKLPRNSSQAFALSKLSGDELIEAWESILEVYRTEKLSAKKIKNYLYPPTSAQVDEMVSHIPINPGSSELLIKLAKVMKLSVNDTVSAILQNAKFYLAFNYTMLKVVLQT